MKALVTGSSIDQTDRCPPSAVLPKAGNLSRAMDKGSAVHEHMEDRRRLGVDEALHRLPEVARHWQLSEQDRGFFYWLCRKIEFMPPRGSLPEQALCLMADGTAKTIDGGRGSYELPGDGSLLPMTIDLMWAQPVPLRRGADGGVECPPDSILYVLDYKTGDDVHVNPVEFNGQALAGALLAARWTGARRVVPNILYLQPGQAEQWDALPYYLDDEALADVEVSLRDVLQRVEQQRQKLEQDETLDYVTGDHCQWCKAAWCCPARLTPLKRLVSPKSKRPMAPEALTAKQAQRLATFVAQGQQLVDQARDALQAYVLAHNDEAIVMADGKVWGPYLQERKRVVPKLALPILQRELGPEEAWSTVKISREAIDKAVRRSYVETEDETAAARVRRLMGEIAKANGLQTETMTMWGIHRPMLTDGVEPGPDGGG
jgi:hypothetical protein